MNALAFIIIFFLSILGANISFAASIKEIGIVVLFWTSLVFIFIFLFKKSWELHKYGATAWSTTNRFEDFNDFSQVLIVISSGIFGLVVVIVFWQAHLMIIGAIAVAVLFINYIKFYNSEEESAKRIIKNQEKRIQREEEKRENQRRTEEFKRQEEYKKSQEIIRKAEEQKRQEDLRKFEEIKKQEQIRQDNEERRNLQDRCIPKNIVARTPDDKDAILKAGDAGEKLLASTFISHGNFTGCFWWSSKRVKDGLGDKGPNEIDLIVLSHNYIYILEAKHYAGILIKNFNRHDKKHPWIRLKPKRGEDGKISSDDTDFDLIENLDDILESKTEKLKAYLLKAGVVISGDYFKRKIVFTNKSFNLDESIKGDPRLISINDLKPYLDSDGGAANDASFFVCALIRYIMQEEHSKKIEIPVDGYQSLAANFDLVRYINSLPSWDHLVFYGGKRVRGDILSGTEIFEDTNGLDGFNWDCDILFNCERDPNLIKKAWDSGKKMKLEIKVSGREKCALNLNYLKPWIKFHVVGEQKPRDISAYEIERLELRGFAGRR